MRRAWESLHIIHCEYCARAAASPHFELLEFWLGIHLALCAAAKQARLAPEAQRQRPGVLGSLGLL